MKELGARCLGPVLTLLGAISCGGIAVTGGQDSTAGSAGLSSGGQAAAAAGSGGALSGAAGANVAGDANLHGEGGSSGPTTAHCALPLSIEDPDLERMLRKQIDKPTQPLYAVDFASVTALNFLSSQPGPCNTAPDCPIPDPALSDGWVTSLVGLECLTQVQEIELDAWYVRDFSPLTGIRELTTLKLFFSKVAHFSPLPQLRELRVFNSDSNLSGLAAMPNLTSFSGSFEDLSAKNALAPLRSLTGLRNLMLSYSELTDVTGLEALSDLATVDLSHNNISDLSPLLQNTALGSNTTIDVSENPITCDDPSVAALVARHVHVEPCVP